MNDIQRLNQSIIELGKRIETLGFPRDKYGVRKEVINPPATDEAKEFDLNCLSYLVECKSTSTAEISIDGQDIISQGQSREYSNKMGLDFVGKVRITPHDGGTATYQITKFILVRK